MKKIFYTMLAASFLLSTSCKKDDDDNGGGSGGNGNPPTGLTATPSSVSVLEGDDANAIISGGAAPYTISSSPDGAIATAAISDSTLTVSGVSEGTTSLTVADSGSINTVNVNITVTAPVSGLLIYTSGTVTADVNGVAFSASGMLVQGTFDGDNLILGFGGNDGGLNPNKQINISLIGVTGPGTYTMTIGAGVYTETVGVTPTAYTNITTGTLTVTSVTEAQATGTFSFTGTDPGSGGMKVITNGTFTLNQ